jgi:hypothetical protein
MVQLLALSGAWFFGVEIEAPLYGRFDWFLVVRTP